MKNLLDLGMKSSVAAQYNIARNTEGGKTRFSRALEYN
jgi:hypothetical protein